MRIGMLLRNSGPSSTRELISACARAADELGIDDVWVLDHIAIPPDDAEGSGGRYVDPYATLAFAAAITERVRLGASVFIASYRAPLPTAKWLASIQELSGGRLCAGFGVGWMPAEFRALGIDRRERGRRTDETLQCIADCFAADEVSLNGQRFLFKPRPARPPILIGGKAEHAFPRILRFGDGWVPTSLDASALRPLVEELAAAMRGAGKPAPEVIPLVNLPLDTAGATAAALAAYAEAGATGIEHAARYESVEEFRRVATALLEARERAL